LWGTFPPLLFPKGVKGGNITLLAPPLPPDRVLGLAPPKEKFRENLPYKYSNFVVNLDYSLGKRYDDRRYVNLGFFSLEGNPRFI